MANNSIKITRVMRRLGFGDGECSQNVAALRHRFEEMEAKGALDWFVRKGLQNVSETLNNEEYARRILAELGDAP